jgi:S1-C subfamily serine protease
MSRSFTSHRIAIFLIAATLGLTACSIGGNGTPTSPTTNPTTGPSASPAASVAIATSAPRATLSPAAAAVSPTFSVAAVNAQVRPAIVQITNSQKVRPRASLSTYVVPAGVGTGFIFDPRGYILTNNHVVAGATTLTVVTSEEKTYDAQLVGADPDGDLAVVKIQGTSDFPTVPLGDSGALLVGQPVVAIGNALALEGGPTVTAGVVSALNRTVQEPPPEENKSQAGPFLVDVIQTDTAINPGNSGGPLLDAGGNVVGINTLGTVEAEPGVPAQGVNFAIAINTARTTAQHLINGERVPRPYFGADWSPLTAVQDAQMKLPANTGIMLGQTPSGSPAAKAGLKQGDVVLKLDGQDIKGEDGFPTLLLRHQPGDTITLTFVRSGPQQTASVVLTQK